MSENLTTSEPKTESFEIPIEAPSETFREHLNQNSRILFSGPFGIGKTYFLNKFFEDHKEDYAAFHLSPVNYVCQENEDVFQLIKCDILYLLLTRFKDQITFEKEDVSKWLSASAFVQKRFTDLLLPFVGMIPKLGKPVKEAVKELMSLKAEYDQIHEEMKTDAEKEAFEFLQEFGQKIGGIYEDDFIIQIIRGLIAQLQKKELKTILILDDLDRMDPDHLFRILNVLAAHTDTQSKENKFGFDKVVVVCDLVNVQKIYAHRYGEGVDFDGYMNKFFETRPYNYHIGEAFRFAIGSLFTRSNLMGKIHEDDLIAGKYYLSLFFIQGHLTPRQLLKCKIVDYKFIDKRISLTKEFSHRLGDFEIFGVIDFLIFVCGSFDQLFQKIKDGFFRIVPSEAIRPQYLISSVIQPFYYLKGEEVEHNTLEIIGHKVKFEIMPIAGRSHWVKTLSVKEIVVEGQVLSKDLSQLDSFNYYPLFLHLLTVCKEKGIFK
ncbi:P-loop NTPase fold protein [Persicobacter diffluens]|uniref:AAA+ ATPase domain-containing protein n=1 Tax=Persicobacter diffluens TaxID=981 RepID=A0AAN4VWC6_9BACT|nr:hypothetical protein PEDI_17430 [Persicobacter diffluens]